MRLTPAGLWCALLGLLAGTAGFGVAPRSAWGGVALWLLGALLVVAALGGMLVNGQPPARWRAWRAAAWVLLLLLLTALLVVWRLTATAVPTIFSHPP